VSYDEKSPIEVSAAVLLQLYTPLRRVVDIGALSDETKALEELSRQLFLESVDLHNEQVNYSVLR